MYLSSLRLGWTTLWRDLRAGELRLMIVAVILAVAALTSVLFFADRLQAGLQRDALQLLGGDVVVASDHPVPQNMQDQAAALNLQTTTTLGFPTMARTTPKQGDLSKLVALKVVASGYPLRGNLRIATQVGGVEQVTRDIPAPGEAWVDLALLEALELQLGDTLLLGDTQFRVGRLIVLEPDRGGGFVNFAPRVMINQLDLATTNLVQPASRVNYRFALVGSSPNIQRFKQWAEAEIARPDQRGLRLETLENGSPEMRQTLDRAEKFLSLVALLAALLSAVAVALAARSFAANHLDDCALLRVLGQSQRTIAQAYIFEFAGVGFVASVLGVLLGFGVHYGFVLLLAGLIDTSLPAASGWPVVIGLGMGMTLLCSFGLPQVLQIANVPPLRVLRRDLGTPKPASVLVLGLGLLGFAGMLLMASNDVQLGWMAVAGFIGALLVFALLSWCAVRLLRWCVNEQTAPRWLVLATRQVCARPVFAVVQVSALAVGLLAIILLVLLRTDLIRSWRQATPADAPNRFVINIQPEQDADFQQALQHAGVHQYDWYPMIRGRLTAVNGKLVKPEDYTEDRAKRLVDREFNISHTAQQPAHNSIVAGQWIANELGGLSVEEGIAKTLGLQLGDTLRFEMGGLVSEAKISSLRKVDWGSMRANFFVIYPVATLPDLPVTYLAAYKAPETPGFDNQLVRRFPNITNVDMRSTILQVQRVLNQVIRAVEFLFGFTLAAGLVVLFAAISATREERAREFAIMRALGASANLLRQVQRAELIGVGWLAGFLAGIAAIGLGWALAHYVFEFSWTAKWWVALVGAFVGSILALLAGWWGLRGVLLRPVMQTLRLKV